MQGLQLREMKGLKGLYIYIECWGIKKNNNLIGGRQMLYLPKRYKDQNMEVHTKIIKFMKF